MRMDSRLYRICSEEYPIMTRLCGNIQRKSIEEQGTRVEMGGDRGAPTGPTRVPTSGALMRGAFRLFLFFVRRIFE